MGFTVALCIMVAACFFIVGRLAVKLNSTQAQLEVLRSEFKHEVVKLRHEIDITQRSIP